MMENVRVRSVPLPFVETAGTVDCGDGRDTDVPVLHDPDVATDPAPVTPEEAALSSLHYHEAAIAAITRLLELAHNRLDSMERRLSDLQGQIEDVEDDLYAEDPPLPWYKKIDWNTVTLDMILIGIIIWQINN